MNRLELIVSRVGGFYLTVFVRVRTKTGVSNPQRAIIDTGAPVTTLSQPRFPGVIYKPGPLITVGRLELPECTIQAIQTEVTVQLEGKGRTLAVPVWLVPDAERVPNLIGLSGIFEQADLHLSLRQSKAYIEFP